MQRRGIIGQAGPLLLARGAATVLGFLLPLILARLLPQAQFGTYKQVWLVASTGYWMLQMGLTASLYYFIPRQDGRGRAWYTQALCGVSLFGAIGALGVYLARFAIARQFNNPELADFGLQLAVITFTMTATAPLEPELLASGQTKLSALLSFSSDAVRVVASVVPLLAGWGLQGFFWAYVLHGALRLSACLWLLWRQGGPELDRKLFLEQLAYALPFGAAILLDTPQKTFHQWAVGSSVDAAAFAIYAQGCFQLPVVSLLYQPISDVLQCRLAAPGGREHGAHLFHDANLRLAAVLFPFTALMLASAGLFVPALFTHRYDGSVPIFRIAVLVTPFAALPLEGVLRATGQTRYVFRIFFWKLVATVPAVLLGIKLGGMVGAIAGHTVADVSIRCMMLARVRRELRCSWGEVLPWAQLGELAVGAVVACAPVVLIARAYAGGPRPLLALCAAGACYAAVYLGALALKPGAGTPFAKVKRVLLGVA